MKSALKLVLFPLFAIGVYCAEVKSVSAKEGDSVPLKSGVTEIQSSDEMEWRLNGNLIFRISSDSNNEITVFDNTNGAYGDRLQLNKQTGDLKIRNIQTTDSGEYKLKIRNIRGSSEETFSVSVDSGWSPAVVAAVISIPVILVAGLGLYYISTKYRQKNSCKYRRNTPEEQPLIKKNSPGSFRTKPM